METHDMPASCCLACGHRFTAASSLTTDERPRPGDTTICIECGNVMVFTDAMTMRAPTEEEMVEIECDPDLIETQRILAEARAAHRSKQ